MVTSLQTEKGRELVKQFEVDARSILSKLHHYHTQSNVAQHEVVTLTTYIINLSLTDSWKGTTRQFLSRFKEKLRLLDSLVPDTDKIPATVRISFLQRAVQQNHDLTRSMPMILCGDPKQDQQENSLLKFIMIYFGMQLINMISTKLQNKHREAFISHHYDPCDNFEHHPEEEDSTNDQNRDEPSLYSVFQSSFNSTAPKKPTKGFVPYQLWGEFPEAAKQMVIEYNKNIKVDSPKPHFHGGKPKPNPTFGKPYPNPHLVHLHEKDDPTENQTPETPTQTMVHECLTESGTDPSDIHNVMSAFNAKGGISSHDSPRTIQVHQRYVFARANQSTNHLIDRGANGGLASADMRVLQKTHWKINIVGIDDHELTGLNVVTAAALLNTQRVLSLEHSMNMLTLANAGLSMLLDKWNGSTARLMTDPRLLEVPKELKLLMDM